MPIDREPIRDLDERTARLGRQWFAEVRQQQRAEEEAEAKRRRSGKGANANDDVSDDAGSWDWLTVDGEAGGGDGG